MISFPVGREGCFNFDGFNFRDYGSAFSKILLSRLSNGLTAEISNTDPPVNRNGLQGESLVKYAFEFECTTEDFRDLNLMANGLLPTPDGFIDKLCDMVVDQIKKDQDQLLSITPLDNQRVTFLHQPVSLVPFSDKKMQMVTTFKVTAND